MTSNTDQMFNAFLSSIDVDWDGTHAMVYTKDGDKWYELYTQTVDPYELLPVCVKSTPKNKDTEAMLLMYGWATNMDDEENTDRVRVRIIIHFHSGAEAMAVQFRGKDLEVISDDSQGMFADTLKNLRLLQESNLL